MPTFSLVNYDRFYVMKTHPRDYDFSILIKEVNLIIEYFEWWLETHMCNDDFDEPQESFWEEGKDIKNKYLPTLEIIRTFIITSEVIHVKNINFLKWIVFRITEGYDTGFHNIFTTQNHSGKYFMKKDDYEYEYEEEEEEKEEEEE
jgi:hypothetical protein